MIPLVYGFWARVLTGPKLSPVGWAAQNVIAPRLGPKKPVAGPPSRFAQLIGAVISTAALVLALIVGDHAAADVVLIAFVPAAGLESIFASCVGCKIFGLLMRAGSGARDHVRRVRGHHSTTARSNTYALAGANSPCSLA